MTKIKYQIQSVANNFWENGWYSTKDSALRHLKFLLKTGYWKPGELRIMKITTTTTTTTIIKPI